MRCWCPTATRVTRLALRLSAFAMRHSTFPPENGYGERSTTVNSRHSQLKGFLYRYRGIATKYLDNYLRWFHLIVLGSDVSACLAAAMSRHAHT